LLYYYDPGTKQQRASGKTQIPRRRRKLVPVDRWANTCEWAAAISYISENCHFG
jgi:hypothetical protein